MDDCLTNQILQVFKEVFSEQNQGNIPANINLDARLLESGLDSLGFAILVVRLEEELGFDPFLLSSTPYYPTTFREFVAFYESNKPK